MTMKELAKLANVSPSAVTKAFSGANDISEQTRAHIFETAKEYGCYGKFLKKKYSKPVIAVVCPEIYGGAYPQFVQQFIGFIEERGGIAVVGDYGFNSEKQSELIEYFCEYLQVDGVFTFKLTSPLKAGNDTPVISLSSVPNSNIPTVIIKSGRAMKEATEYLNSLGHKSIAFFGEERTVLKEENFLSAVSRHKESCVFKSKYRFEKAGEDCAEKMLKSKENFTAVICAYDNIAFGAMKYFKEHGLNIPCDISIIGMDNSELCEHTDPPLTTIANQYDKICKEAWELFLKKRKNKFFLPKVSPVVENKLIIRKSTAKVK